MKLSNAIPYLYDKLLSFFYKGSMKFCGKHVYIRPSCSDFKGLWNMRVGDGTSIPIDRELNALFAKYKPPKGVYVPDFMFPFAICRMFFTPLI